MHKPLNHKKLELRDTFIYLLIDPLTNEIRYVGVSVDPQKRFNKHLSSKETNYKWKWINSLLKINTKPILKIFQKYKTFQDALDAEIYWIKYFKNIGCKLTNLTDGGEGVSGRICKLETRNKISKMNKGTPPSASTRLAVSLALKGKKRSLDSINKGVASRKGYSPSQETRDLIRKIRTGTVRSKETCLKLSIAKSNPSTELREKISKSVSIYFKSLENRIKNSRSRGGTAIKDNNGIIYPTIAEASRKLGINGSKISQILSGKRKQTKGFSFTRVLETSQSFSSPNSLDTTP